MLRTVVGVVLAMTLIAGGVAAQQSILVTGTVKDVSGAVLPGATIDIFVADQAVAAATTSDKGSYQVAAPAGVPLQIRARLDGFAEQAVDVPGATSAVTRDITLQIGRASDTVVVTASRAPESLSRVTQSMTVVTADEIHALGGSSLADAVRFVPGVTVEANGREGGVTSMFSRGGESDYNLVLIDGVRVNQNGGGFDFSRISAADIDRVEVVRGAQSSLWGSDAMGSVVQVFTKRGGAADPPQIAGSVEGGSFSTFRGDLRLFGGAAGRADYQAGVSHRQTDGAFGDILPEDDTFEQTGFDATGGTALGTRATLRVGVRYTRAQGRSVGQMTFGERNTGGVYDTKDLSWHAAVSHTLGSRYTGSATVNYFSYDALSEDTVVDPSYSTFAILEGTPGALFPNGIRVVRYIDEAEFNQLAAAGAMPAPGQYIASAESFFNFPYSSRNELRRPGFRYQGEFTWANGQRLIGGWDWEREIRPEQTSPSTLPELRADNNAFFVQQQFNFVDRWFVTVGARADDRETLGTFFSPRLSAGGFLLPVRPGTLSSVKVFGNVGKGIKSPLFAERYGSPFNDPNPDLKVERARTADLGVEATFADQHIRAGATYFNNDYEDQIAYRFGPVGDQVPEYINIDGSQADGWELEVALQRPVAGVTAGVTYALVDTEVVTNISTSQQFQPGQPLLRRPKHSGTIRIGYGVGKLSASFDTLWLSDRHDSGFLFLQTVPNAASPPFFTDITVNPGYSVSGFIVDYEVDRRATVFVRVNNIGDTKYDSLLGYPGTPRNAMVGVRFDVAR